MATKPTFHHETLSSQTLDAMAQAITGGSGFGIKPAPGRYRAGHELKKFFRAAGVDFRLDNRSRVRAVRDFLEELRPDQLAKALELVTDPRDYIQEPGALTALIDYLNAFLEFDGLELVRERRATRVRKLGATGAVVGSFSDKTIALNFEAVRVEVQRALESAERDPPVAVTAACVIIESVCRSILAELGLEAPAKRDVEGLLRAVQEPLNLSPSRSDLSPLIAADVRQVLGGLTTVAKGIGAMRTHGGNAHAPELGQTPVDARIARFAIHSASTLALFLVETWERKKRLDRKGQAL